MRILKTYIELFDKLCNRYHVEKVKNFGEIYVCVGGLYSTREYLNIAKMAHRLMKEVKSINEKNKWATQVRIGICQGLGKF